MWKQSNNFFVILMHEIIGAASIGCIFWQFNMSTNYYLSIPFLGIPVAIAIEGLSHFFFWPVRKYFPFKLKNKRPKDEKSEKDEILLFNLNISRSLFFIMLIMLLLTIWSEKYNLIIWIVAPIFSLIFLGNVFRYELKFSYSMYPGILNK